MNSPRSSRWQKEMAERSEEGWVQSRQCGSCSTCGKKLTNVREKTAQSGENKKAYIREYDDDSEAPGKTNVKELVKQFHTMKIRSELVVKSSFSETAKQSGESGCTQKAQCRSCPECGKSLTNVQETAKQTDEGKGIQSRQGVGSPKIRSKHLTDTQTMQEQSQECRLVQTRQQDSGMFGDKTLKNVKARTQEFTTDLQLENRQHEFVDKNPTKVLEGESVLIGPLLCRLGLENKYEDKLTKAEFLEISKSTLQNKEPSKENELVHVFMKRLLTGDYTARQVSVKNDTEIQESPSIANADAFTALFKKRSVKTNRKQAEIHPMDVQMALFLCADDFLRQIMVNKLAQCQYAIPLLVPNPFSGKIECPLWTIRQINKNWKSSDASGEIISKTLPVYKAETPMVAFFRLGSVSSSKSQLINHLINEKHNTFFHKHCPGSSRTRLLMDGVVEIAWYCPSGKSSDHFSECVAFCNLHGDSSIAVTQREILTTMASVNVILLPKLDEEDHNMGVVKDLYKSQTPLIVVLTDEEDDNDGTGSEIGNGKYKIGLKGSTQANVSAALRNVIKKCIFQKHMTFNLESITKNVVISVDESNEACRRGKKAAQTVMSFLDGKDPLTVKEKYLPCQGKLWHDWCQKSKGLRQLQSNTNIETELSRNLEEMKELRWKQQEPGVSGLIRSFVDNLQKFSVSENNYFLRWTGIYLDEFILEKLHKMKPEELKQMSPKMNAASFGLEHLLREMGQIYEASVSEEKNMTGKGIGNFSYLPELAAELLISGHPVELMDGDTAYVPLTWVSALLDEVIRKLGDKKVFVLSVLGIQSSGKSTMLNAMFGLEFAVSAGRCTRGAFIQLVKVSEDKKKDLKFDYILVVDTEGLRSSELSGNAIHQDNELSTFVVGLANMTLININGENLTEMQEILQIVVHAFLRMKQVRLNPSCMFVHQNVSDIAAREKIRDGRRHLQETLDKMTKLASDEYNCAERFTDVIAFDVENDVRYFAHLWEGSPPMAPPNPLYSENIQELKRDIISRAATTDVLKLSQFQKRVKDLWNALLNENFVFSFKNAQEISVYRKLEREYGKWTWSLRNAMMTVENKILNRVASGTVKTIQRQNLEEEMTDTLQTVQKECNQFFEKNSEKETLIQWKCKFETQVNHLYDDLIEDARRKVDESIQQKRIRHKLDQKLRKYEKVLFEKSKELALKLKGNINNKMHANEFNLMWGKWIFELTDQAPKFKDVEISKDITHVLGEIYKTDLVINRKCSNEYKQIGTVNDYNSYITKKNLVNKKSIKLWSGSFLKAENNKSIHSLINNVTEQIKQTVESFPFITQGYNSGYLYNIAHDVKEQVQEFETQVKKERKLSDDASVFNQDFYVDFSLYVCEQSANRISDLHRKFKEANDPVIYFEWKKTEYFNIFQKYCDGATSAAILGDQVCSKLKEAILQSVYNMMAPYVCGQMRGKPPFNGNRADLEKHILKSLAEQKGEKAERFNNYLTYMYQPRVHFENFIRTRVKEFMAAENPQADSAIKECIDHKQRSILSAATVARDEVKRVNGDANHWMEVFSNSLTDELGDTRVHLCDEEGMASIDYDVLMDAISKELLAVVEELKRDLSRVSDLAMEMFRERPDEILIKHFCICCWEQCPFCGAVCTNSQKHHPGDHNADFHRSTGMRGVYYKERSEFLIDFCTTVVASEQSFCASSEHEIIVPCKRYREAGGAYATWGISTDFSELAYWKWFVCEFKKNLEKHHNKQFSGRGKIPEEWKTYSQSDAVRSLGIHLSKW
ncbi:interferon-induced very large GTPase 1-like isoform X2 [Silurus meridionalis]|nr:interferon-induced very large GTPase 1-like isoform X2 [Silurus meridionalis]